MDLTEDQARALIIYTSGHPLKVVADRMGITYMATQDLVAKAKRANGCSNLGQLIAQAFRHGYIQ